MRRSEVGLKKARALAARGLAWAVLAPAAVGLAAAGAALVLLLLAVLAVEWAWDEACRGRRPKRRRPA